MTETVDTVFKALMQSEQAASSCPKQLQEAMKAAVGDKFDGQWYELWTSAQRFYSPESGQDFHKQFEDCEDPEARSIKLAMIKLSETVLREIKLNSQRDYTAELAPYWPREATTPQVAEFLDQNDCRALSTIVFVAALNGLDNKPFTILAPEPQPVPPGKCGGDCSKCGTCPGKPAP